MNKWKLHLFRLGLIMLLGLLFYTLVNQHLALDGTLELEKRVHKPSPFFSRLLPDARTGDLYRDSEGAWRRPVVAEPTYMTLTPPRQSSISSVRRIPTRSGWRRTRAGGVAHGDG